jgi:hypothetical protein
MPNPKKKRPATAAINKQKHPIEPASLEAYQRLIDSNPDIELKGAAVPYTSFNGHMFSYFEKDGSFGLRLPEKERDEFLKKYKSTLFISYGIVKKEFVLVPQALLLDTKKIKPYFDISFRYVSSLKPK